VLVPLGWWWRREELEKQRGRERYLKLQAEGKTEQAQKDLGGHHHPAHASAQAAGPALLCMGCLFCTLGPSCAWAFSRGLPLNQLTPCVSCLHPWGRCPVAARLEIIRKQREDASKKREEERLGGQAQGTRLTGQLMLQLFCTGCRTLCKKGMQLQRATHVAIAAAFAL